MGRGFMQQQICKPGSVQPQLPEAISIINLLQMLPSGFNQPTHPDVPDCSRETETSSSAFRTYLVFQLLRFTAIPVARESRELLPHVFTLTPTGRGGIFSVALAVAGCRRLPVRKQDTLCCPDFPLTPIVSAQAIERFARQR